MSKVKDKNTPRGQSTTRGGRSQSSGPKGSGRGTPGKSPGRPAGRPAGGRSSVGKPAVGRPPGGRPSVGRSPAGKPSGGSSINRPSVGRPAGRGQSKSPNRGPLARSPGKGLGRGVRTPPGKGLSRSARKGLGRPAGRGRPLERPAGHVPRISSKSVGSGAASVTSPAGKPVKGSGRSTSLSASKSASPKLSSRPASSSALRSAPSTTAKSEPSSSAKPGPSSSAKPGPSSSAKPGPSSTAKPGPSSTEKSTPTSTSRRGRPPKKLSSNLSLDIAGKARHSTGSVSVRKTTLIRGKGITKSERVGLPKNLHRRSRTQPVSPTSLRKQAASELRSSRLQKRHSLASKNVALPSDRPGGSKSVSNLSQPDAHGLVKKEKDVKPVLQVDAHVEPDSEDQNSGPGGSECSTSVDGNIPVSATIADVPSTSVGPDFPSGQPTVTTEKVRRGPGRPKKKRKIVGLKTTTLKGSASSVGKTTNVSATVDPVENVPLAEHLTSHSTAELASLLSSESVVDTVNESSQGIEVNDANCSSNERPNVAIEPQQSVCSNVIPLSVESISMDSANSESELSELGPIPLKDGGHMSIDKADEVPEETVSEDLPEKSASKEATSEAGPEAGPGEPLCSTLEDMPSVSTLEPMDGGEVSTVEPAVSSDQAVAPLEEPVAHPEEPVATLEEPVAHSEEPVAHSEEPVAHSEEPVAPSEETVAHPEEPVTHPEEPVAPPEEPDAPPEEPVAPQEEPVTHPEEPVAPQEEPVTHPEEPVAPQEACVSFTGEQDFTGPHLPQGDITQELDGPLLGPEDPPLEVNGAQCPKDAPLEGNDGAQCPQDPPLGKSADISTGTASLQAPAGSVQAPAATSEESTITPPDVSVVISSPATSPPIPMATSPPIPMATSPPIPMATSDVSAPPQMSMQTLEVSVERLPAPPLASPSPIKDNQLPMCTLGPSMGEPGPFMDSSGPSVGTSGPSVGTSGPSMGTPGLSVGTPDPSVGTPDPSVGTAGPSVSTPGPSVGTPGPSVGTLGPSGGTSGPSVSTLGPSDGTLGPSVGTPGPFIGTSGPSVVSCVPPSDAACVSTTIYVKKEPEDSQPAKRKRRKRKMGQYSFFPAKRRRKTPSVAHSDGAASECGTDSTAVPSEVGSDALSVSVWEDGGEWSGPNPPVSSGSGGQLPSLNVSPMAESIIGEEPANVDEGVVEPEGGVKPEGGVEAKSVPLTAEAQLSQSAEGDGVKSSSQVKPDEQLESPADLEDPELAYVDVDTVTSETPLLGSVQIDPSSDLCESPIITMTTLDSAAVANALQAMDFIEDPSRRSTHQSRSTTKSRAKPRAMDPNKEPDAPPPHWSSRPLYELLDEMNESRSNRSRSSGSASRGTSSAARGRSSSGRGNGSSGRTSSRSASTSRSNSASTSRSNSASRSESGRDGSHVQRRPRTELKFHQYTGPPGTSAAKQGPSNQGPSGTSTANQGPFVTGTANQGPFVTGTANQGPSGTANQGPFVTGTANQGPSGTANQGPSGTGTANQGPSGTGTANQGPSGTSTANQGPSGTANQGPSGTVSSNQGPVQLPPVAMRSLSAASPHGNVATPSAPVRSTTTVIVDSRGRPSKRGLAESSPRPRPSSTSFKVPRPAGESGPQPSRPPRVRSLEAARSSEANRFYQQMSRRAPTIVKPPGTRSQTGSGPRSSRPQPQQPVQQRSSVAGTSGAGDTRTSGTGGWTSVSQVYHHMKQLKSNPVQPPLTKTIILDNGRAKILEYENTPDGRTYPKEPIQAELERRARAVIPQIVNRREDGDPHNVTDSSIENASADQQSANQAEPSANQVEPSANQDDSSNQQSQDQINEIATEDHQSANQVQGESSSTGQSAGQAETTANDAAVPMETTAGDVAVPMATAAGDVAVPVETTAGDAAVPMATGAGDAAVPMATTVCDAAVPMATAAGDAAVPMATATGDAAVPGDKTDCVVSNDDRATHLGVAQVSKPVRVSHGTAGVGQYATAQMVPDRAVQAANAAQGTPPRVSGTARPADPALNSNTDVTSEAARIRQQGEAIRKAKTFINLAGRGTRLGENELIYCHCALCATDPAGVALAKELKAGKDALYCQALDHCKDKLLGCMDEVVNLRMAKVSPLAPAMALCKKHHIRVRRHHVCSCGIFCTEGFFVKCTPNNGSDIHLSHPWCQVFRDGNTHCPHCGLITKGHLKNIIPRNGREDVELPAGLVEPLTGEEAVCAEEEEAAAAIARQNPPPASPSVPAVNGAAFLAVRSKIPPPKPASRETVLAEMRARGIDPAAVAAANATVRNHRSSALEGRPQRNSAFVAIRNFTNSSTKTIRDSVAKGDLAGVMTLMQRGIDLSVTLAEVNGGSLLHLAVEHDQAMILTILIRAKLNKDAVDNDTQTPLIKAVIANKYTSTDLLIRGGASVNQAGLDGMTALHYAAKAGHYKLVKTLVKYTRTNVNAVDDGGWPALVWAAENRFVRTVKLLLEKGADPNIVDNEGNTALHWAAFTGSAELAHLFLKKSCDMNMANTVGDRPLHIASRRGYYGVVAFLLACGANSQLINNNRERPAEVASTDTLWTVLNINFELVMVTRPYLLGGDGLLRASDISKGSSRIPIPCFNNVDDANTPDNFKYIETSVEGAWLRANRVITEMQCCKCEGKCTRASCGCYPANGPPLGWYTAAGRLRVSKYFADKHPPPIYECNAGCSCLAVCRNRVVQLGAIANIQVFRTSNRGWGVRAGQDIEPGTFVCEFTGLLSYKAMDRYPLPKNRKSSAALNRDPIVPSVLNVPASKDYTFALPVNDTDCMTIDAEKYGNVSRFINHSCCPNIAPVQVFVEHQDKRFPRICFFAIKEISKGEEIGFHYGLRFWVCQAEEAEPVFCCCGSTDCSFSKTTLMATREQFYRGMDQRLVREEPQMARGRKVADTPQEVGGIESASGSSGGTAPPSGAQGVAEQDVGDVESARSSSGGTAPPSGAQGVAEQDVGDDPYADMPPLEGEGELE